MKVKQHFIFISNNNCHQNNGKLCSTVFRLIKWRQACCITNVNSTENTSKYFLKVRQSYHVWHLLPMKASIIKESKILLHHQKFDLWVLGHCHLVWNVFTIVNRLRNGYETISNIKVVSFDSFKQLELINVD